MASITIIVTLSCAVLFGKIKKSAVQRRISFRWQMASITIIVTLSCAVLFGDQKIRRATADFLSMANGIDHDNRHTFVRCIHWHN